MSAENLISLSKKTERESKQPQYKERKSERNPFYGCTIAVKHPQGPILGA